MRPTWRKRCGPPSRPFPAWRRTPAPRRGELLYGFAALLAEHKERLARALTAEMGKVLPEARGDVQEAIDIAYLMAGEGRRLFGDTVPSELPDKWAMSVREPIGVAGLITPWNFPIAIPAWKMMPALVAGNTVVWKPASDTPHCAVLFVELLAEAGLPAGVVNLVTGSGADAGEPLVASPDVPVLSFTGHGDNGRRIAVLAARRLKRLSLELGGKNGIIVLADADLDLAVDGIVWSAFGTTGQRCTACSRVIVQEAVADALVDRLAERAAALRLGPGLDPQTDVGPLINRPAVDKVGGYAALAERDGQRLVTGGSAPSGDARLRHGHYFTPTIVDHVQPMSRLGQEEVFGPLLSIIRVPDYDAAVTALNQTPYGLSAAIYTRDANAAFRAMHDMAAGLVYINAGTIGAETHLPVRRHEGHRQRPSRGRPRRARHVHRVEVHLRRLQRPPAARPDRQPARLRRSREPLPLGPRARYRGRPMGQNGPA